MGDFSPLVLLGQNWLTVKLAVFRGMDSLEADRVWERKHALNP